MKRTFLNHPYMQITGDEAFKSICRVLGPLTKKPTLGVQHAVEAGYLFKEHASISAWLFTFLSYCEVTKPLSRIKTITRMRRIYKRRLVIPGFIISEGISLVSYRKAIQVNSLNHSQ